MRQLHLSCPIFKTLLLTLSLFLTSCAGIKTLMPNSAAGDSTGNQNYNVNISRCYAKGNDVFVEFVFRNLMNVDGEDLRIDDVTSDIWYTAYDDSGNRYYYDFVSDNVNVVNVVGHSRGNLVGGIPAGVPIKAVAKIDKVSPSAKSLSLIRFHMQDYNHGFPRIDQDITFRNVPIER